MAQISSIFSASHRILCAKPYGTQKLVKTYRKYLRNFSSDLKNFAIQKLLPKLARLSVNSTRTNSWKILLSRSAFQTLHFILNPENSRQKSLFLKYKYALSGNLLETKQLKKLKILVSSKETASALLMLEIVSSKASLHSFKDFLLNLPSNHSSANLNDLPKINKTIEHLTSLVVSNPE